MTTPVLLCPGQGAQAPGMGRAWAEGNAAARRVFETADRALGDRLGASLSTLCWGSASDRLNRTDISQPAIFTCSVACWRGLAQDHGGAVEVAAAAGLSLGEYTALHLAGAIGFEECLHLVAERGRLMQEAAEASEGGMLALIGADEARADEVCRVVLERDAGAVLVPANFNAPGQIVLSGHRRACEAAAGEATARGLRSTLLPVAGAFHSPLMGPAAEGLARALECVSFADPAFPVWSNVTAEPHQRGRAELLRKRLVEQLVRPVRWMETCGGLVGKGYTQFLELAPGSVLRGLMRRIHPGAKVVSHDQPEQRSDVKAPASA